MMLISINVQQNNDIAPSQPVQLWQGKALANLAIGFEFAKILSAKYL